MYARCSLKGYLEVIYPELVQDHGALDKDSADKTESLLHLGKYLIP